MACRTSIERRVWAVAVALGLCVVAPAVEAQQVVKLAAGVPLTGPLAKQGQEVADAVKLAAEEWNKKGGVLGRKIEVLEADDQGNPQVGVAAAEKVAADAAVLGAVWGITSVTCIPVSEVLDRVNLVLISPGCTNPKVTDRGLKNTNRVCARDDAQGPAKRSDASCLVPDLKTTPAPTAYVKAVEAKYGPVSSYGPLAYEAANIILEAIQKVGKADRAAVRDAVRATKNYKGILGVPISLDDKGDVAGGVIYFYRVKGAGFEQVKQITVK